MVASGEYHDVTIKTKPEETKHKNHMKRGTKEKKKQEKTRERPKILNVEKPRYPVKRKINSWMEMRQNKKKEATEKKTTSRPPALVLYPSPVVHPCGLSFSILNFLLAVSPCWSVCSSVIQSIQATLAHKFHQSKRTTVD